MNLLECGHCESNLVNLIAVKIKHDEYADRNINIKKEYIAIEKPIAVKFLLKCYNCNNLTERKIENKRGCTSFSLEKLDTKLQNEIIDELSGGRFY
jgi:hypothetical protein